VRLLLIGEQDFQDFVGFKLRMQGDEMDGVRG
jgi:hypothetical protein